MKPEIAQFVARTSVWLKGSKSEQESQIFMIDLNTMLTQMGIADHERAAEFVSQALQRINADAVEWQLSLPQITEYLNPLPEYFGYKNADDAYKAALDCCHSSKRHELDKLVYSTCFDHWSELQDVRKERWWKDRYVAVFRRHILQNETLKQPPEKQVLLESKQATEKDKAVGNETLGKLLEGL